MTLQSERAICSGRVLHAVGRPARWAQHGATSALHASGAGRRRTVAVFLYHSPQAQGSRLRGLNFPARKPELATLETPEQHLPAAEGPGWPRGV